MPDISPTESTTLFGRRRTHMLKHWNAAPLFAFPSYPQAGACVLAAGESEY